MAVFSFRQGGSRRVAESGVLAWAEEARPAWCASRSCTALTNIPPMFLGRRERYGGVASLDKGHFRRDAGNPRRRVNTVTGSPRSLLVICSLNWYFPAHYGSWTPGAGTLPVRSEADPGPMPPLSGGLPYA